MNKQYKYAALAAIALCAAGWAHCAGAADRYNITEGSRVWPTGVVVYSGSSNVGTLAEWQATAIAGATNNLTPVNLAWSTDYARVTALQGATQGLVNANVTNSAATVAQLNGATNAAVMRTGWDERGNVSRSTYIFTGNGVNNMDLSKPAGNAIIMPGYGFTWNGVEEALQDNGAMIISNGNLKVHGQAVESGLTLDGGVETRWVGKSSPKPTAGNNSFIEFGPGGQYAKGERGISLGYGDAIGVASIAGGDATADGSYSTAFSDGRVYTSFWGSTVVYCNNTITQGPTYRATGAVAMGYGFAAGLHSMAVCGTGPEERGQFPMTIASNANAFACGAGSQVTAYNSVAFNGTKNSAPNTTSVGEPVLPNNAATKSYADAISNTAAVALAQRFAATTYYSSPTVTVNAAVQSIVVLTVTNNVVIAAPTNAFDGKRISWRITCDGTNRTVAWPAASFKIPLSSTMTSPITINAGSTSVFLTEYDLLNTRWLIESYIWGY